MFKSSGRQVEDSETRPNTLPLRAVSKRAQLDGDCEHARSLALLRLEIVHASQPRACAAGKNSGVIRRARGSDRGPTACRILLASSAVASKSLGDESRSAGCRGWIGRAETMIVALGDESHKPMGE